MRRPDVCLGSLYTMSLPRTRPILLALSLAALVGLLLGWLVRDSVTTEEANAEKRIREHAQAVEQVRSAVAATVAGFHSDLLQTDVPEWAGSYSWSSCLPGMSGCEAYQEHLVLSPSGDAAWWFGTSDFHAAEFVDCGRVVRVDPATIVVRWTVDPSTPHILYDPWLPTHLLCDELVRFEVSGKSHVLPAIRVPIFCASLRGGTFPTLTFPTLAALAPQRCEQTGGVVSEVTMVASEVAMIDPRDARLPSPWNEYLPAEPLSSPVTLVESPVRVGRMKVQLTPRWKRILGYPDDAWYRWTFEAGIGSDDGVKIGMRMRLEPGGDRSGVVQELSAHSCRIQFLLCSRDAHPPSTYLTVRTMP